MGYGYPGSGMVTPAASSAWQDDEPATPRRPVGRLREEEGPTSSAPVGDVAKAKRQIETGDGCFAEGDYRKAYARYKDAAKSAPAFAEAYFRQTQAAIAQGRYELAMESVGRGIEWNPAWAKSNMRLEKLYGQKQAAWKQHRDALIAEAAAHPQDANLQFLAGVVLHFSGQPLQAEKYFVHANQLGASQHHLAGFFRAIDARAAASQQLTNGTALP